MVGEFGVCKSSLCNSWFGKLLSAVNAAARMSLAIALAVLPPVLPAQAAVVVDQQSLAAPTPQTPVVVASRVGMVPASSAAGAPLDTRFAVQTITAGVRGTLDRVELQIGQNVGQGLFGIGLFDGEWSPTSSAFPLSFAQVPTQFLPSTLEALNQTRLFTFFVGDYHVAPGQIFSLVFGQFPTAPGTSATSLIIGSGSRFVPGQTPTFNINQYGGGGLTTYSNGVALTGGFPNASVGFRTYVDTAGVPEPATWAMLILGFGMIGGAMRRRISGQRSTPLTLPHVRAAV
jgi:hypothetical protein